VVGSRLRAALAQRVDRGFEFKSCLDRSARRYLGQRHRRLAKQVCYMGSAQSAHPPVVRSAAEPKPSSALARRWSSTGPARVVGRREAARSAVSGKSLARGLPAWPKPCRLGRSRAAGRHVERRHQDVRTTVSSNALSQAARLMTIVDLSLFAERPDGPTRTCHRRKLRGRVNTHMASGSHVSVSWPCPR
jgi:hypothetical protein